jgi:hypothetical protein
MQPPHAGSSDDELPEAVFSEVADAALGEPAARATRLSELRARHPEHAAGIDNVVAAITGSDRLLADAFAPAAVATPATIGRYRVLRTLGEGAFGIVYLAIESQPVRREVAIKALRPGAGDRFTLQRFAAEQQLLASLDHPAIVRILEAGALPDGRPYFVMDRIDGSPLGEYVRARGLPVADTVRLVLAVCRGVQHAHARGVVHRDLKPANVLVTEVDGRPAPRIIDFGIAKLFEADDGVRPFATDPGRMVGTPGYMSPEQRVGGAAAASVDARADVFALGVTLFELLVGERPWAGDALPDAAEPPRASAARRRHSKGGAADAVARQLRGDIDRILAKALQHAPAERYADAGALADDLERHLAGRPIAAARPSLFGSALRALRRHRSRWVATAALALVAGLGVGGVTYWRAQAEQADARRIDEALQMAELLLRRASEPVRNDTLDDAVRAQLANEAVAVHERLRTAPLRPLSLVTQARALAARLFLADCQNALGEFDAAIALAQECLPEAAALVAAAPLPANRRLLASAWREIGRNAFLLRRHDLAREGTTKALAEYALARGDGEQGFDPDYCKTLLEHASALGATGDPAGQLAAIEDAVSRLRQRVAAAADDENAVRDMVRTLSGLANLWLKRGDDARVEAALNEAIAVAASSRFPLPEERGRVGLRLAQLNLKQGRLAAALASATDARDCMMPVLARQPNRSAERLVLISIHALRAEACQRLGDADGAAAAAAEMIDASSIGNAAARRRAVDMLVALARLRLELGDRRGFATAADWMEAALRLLPADGTAGAVRCEVRLLRAILVTQRGVVVERAELEELAQAAERDAPERVGWVQSLLAQRLLDDGADQLAAAALAAAESAKPPAPALFLVRLRIRHATQRGDLAAARAAIEAAAADPGASSEAALGAFRLLPLANASADPADLRAFVGRIATGLTAARGDGMGEDIDAEARLAHAQAVAVAACAGETGSFDARQARALAVLLDLRPTAPMADWDEALWFALVQRRLAAERATAGPVAVLASLRDLLPELSDCGQLLGVCDALAGCLADDTAGAHAAAIDAAAAVAIQRAIAAGLRGAAAKDRPAMRSLGCGPAAAAAIASIPD